MHRHPAGSPVHQLDVSYYIHVFPALGIPDGLAAHSADLPASRRPHPLLYKTMYTLYHTMDTESIEHEEKPRPGKGGGRAQAM